MQDIVKSCKRILLLVRGDGTVLAFNGDPTVATHQFGQVRVLACTDILSSFPSNHEPKVQSSTKCRTQDILHVPLNAHAAADLARH